MDSEVPVQKVLELACSAHRTNGGYLKPNEVHEDNKVCNRTLMMLSLGVMNWESSLGPAPQYLVIKDEDLQLADAMRKFFRRLTLKVLEDPDNVFDTTVHELLNKDTMKVSHIGFIACLPVQYFRDSSRIKIKSAARNCEDGFLADVGCWLTDLDCEILEVKKSINFDAWNITAVIDNKMVSWMTKKLLTPGPSVIQKAKIKEHSKHWLHENDVTRMHYVSAAQ